MARPPKDKEDLKDQRIAVMMSKAELELIDDWAFASRIRSRGEAIRRLCLRSIVKDKKTVQDGQMKRLMEMDDE